MRKIKLFLTLLMLMCIGVTQMWADFSKASEIAVGDVVAFVCEGKSMDLTSISTTSTTYGIGTEYSTTPACTWTFTVEEGSSEGSFSFKNGNNYLSWSSGNSLATSTTKNANSSWTVVFTDGHATITNVNTTNRVIWWNVSSPRFACYTSKEDGNDYKYTQIYKEVSSGDNPGGDNPGGDEPGGDDPAPSTGAPKVVDFESATSAYTSWTFTNFTTQQTNSNVTAHGGSYFGTTGGKATGSLQTAEKIANPESITFYYSKTSTNTTTSTWYVQVSSDGTNWENVGEGQSAAADVTRGTWYDMTRDLSSYSNVYVRIYYDGTTAVRTLDDVELTLSAGGGGDKADVTDEQLAWSASQAEVTIGAENSFPSLTNSLGLDVTYQSTATAVATIAANGDITLVKAGSTTIEAVFAGNDDYNAKTVSYELTVNPAPACELKVTISKGTPEIGSFSLNKEEGAYETCDAAFEVIVTPAEVEHYHVSEVTASNSTSISGPDADGKYTITYEQETNAASTINVTFIEDTKYDVTWNVNGVESTNKAYHGAHPTLPAAPTSSCDETSTTFMGWAAEAWSGKLAAPAVTVYTSAADMPVVEAEGVKYYAVFAKSSGAAAKLFEWKGGTKAELEAAEGVAALEADNSDYAEANAPYRVKWNGTGKYIIISVASQPGIVSAGFKMIGGATTSTVTVQEADDAEGPFTDVENLAISGSANDEVDIESTQAFKSTTRAIKLYYTKGSNVGLGPISIEGVVSYTDYMTTCCTKYNVNIAEGITNGSVSADLAKACEGATVTLTITPATNYHLKTLSVMNGETPVAVTENTFTMPAGNVIISATFEEDACTPLNTPSVTVSGKAYPYDAVKLAWTAIDNANLYKVYIYDAEDNELEKDEAFEGVEYTIDLDLEASTTYKYSVQAISNTPAVHCPSVAATGTFATDALPTAHLTLMVNGSEATTLSGDHAILTPFDLPTPAAVEGCPKVFVGWSADADRTTAPEYATGTKYTFANETPATLYAVFAKENAGTEVTYPIDFEADAATYTDWAFNNMVSNYTNSGVTAHGGSKIGSTDGKATASVTTAAKIANPQSITFYVSKQSTNTTESYWKVEVSADGSAWTQVGDAQSATSMSKGTWVEVTRDLSEYSDVYVRVYYGSNTAVRVIDDLVLSAVGSATYSEYGTACEACKVVTLAKSGEDQEKGNTFALKVGKDVVESVQTCEAASVTIEPTVATGYEVSFAISELEGASLSENTISLAAATNGTLTVTATYSQINHKVVLAQTPEIGATLIGATEEAHYGATINLSATNIPEGYVFTGWTPAELFADAETAAAANTSFTMPNNDVTVTANFAKKYTVTFNVGSNPITEESVGAGVTLPEGPAQSAACVTAGWAFAGWAEAAVASETTDAQTLYTGEYHPTKDITLYAVYSRTESGDAPAETNYVKTAFADLVSGDAIVITNDAYAMSHSNKGTKGQPNAVAVTVAENVITSSVEGLVWDITKGEENFSLAVHGGTDNLYCTSDNNGVRVGENANISFQIDDDYLYHVDEGRYLGVYQSTDWRCYTSINSNISGQTLAFYKAVSTSSSTTYYWSAPECCTPHNVTIADNIEHGTVVANPTSACADATITVTLTPAEGYELTAWTVDGTEQALNATTFTMPNKDVVVSATFSEIVTPPAEATLKLMENGNEVVFAGNHNVGEVVTLPNALSDDEHACEGKVLKGWSTVKITTPVATKPSENFYELNAEYTILTAEDDTLYAVFAEEGAGAETITSDVLDRALTGITGTTYSAWSGKQATSNAVYAGQSAGSNESIQLRSNNSNSGIVTTTTGGKARKVTVTWNSNTSSGRTIDIYGKNAAYSAATDLYDNTKQGTKLGSIVYGTSTELTIDADYEYIGIRSASGALYLSDVTIDWGTPGDVVYSNYATSCVAPLANPTFSLAEQEEAFTTAQTIELSAEEGTIYYTLNGATPTSASIQYEAEAPIVLNDCGTTTIKAIAISANNHSEVVSATYTINIPLPTISEANPYTPAQAIEVFDGNCYNNEMVYVKGVVKTSSGLNTTYGNYDNIVVVAAETTAPEFTFFHMYKGAEKVQFDANDPAIAAGDTIVAYGELTKYGQIYEFKDGCYLIDRKAYNVPKQSIVNDIEHPYTLAQAINFLEDAATYDLSGEVYVKGVATTAPNNFGTFNAHDPELENVFQFYNTDLNELTVGVNDTIIVKGLIKKVNANYRMEAGVVQQVTAYVAPVVPEFTVDPTAVAFGNVEQNAQVDAIELNVELTAIASAKVTLDDENNVFSIDKTALTETGVVTVSVVSTATVGNYAATITLHDVAEAAEDVVINVSMNVTAVDPRHKAQDIDGFDATSGNLNSEISFASVQGDGTAVPALQSNGSILYYQPASGKAAGGYMTLTAVHGCKIDQVKVVTATHATNIKYSKDGGELSEASDEIAAGGEYLTPASLDAETVNIYCAGDDKNHRLYIAQVVVYYTGEAIPVHHKAIDITGMEASQFEFPKNGTFTHEGLKVYACYDENCNEKVEITADCHVEADLTTTGEKKAKVYYGEEFVDEYDINVIAGQENPALAYTPTSETIAAANVASWSAPSFSNPLNVSPISFSSNNTAVATVDENGVIALAGGYGTAKITASFAETEEYIASVATYTITVQEPANKIAGEWRLVTSTADITVGSKVIIVGTKNNTKYAMGEQKSNNRAAVAVVSEDATSGVIEPAEGTKTFTLVDAGEGMYAFKANNGKYLYAAGSTYLREQATINGNASWTITITSGGTTIEANGTNSNKSMRMNPNAQNDPLFSSYASGQNAVTLYVNRKEYVAPAVDPENPTPATPVAINTNVEEEEIVANGNVIVTVNTDNFEEPKSYIAQNGATIVINGNGAEEAKSVIADEQSTIQVNQQTTVNQVFSVSATMGAGLSGQITGVDNVTIAESTEAYFDITLGDNANPDKWHAIAVPFPVDAISGIYDAETGAKLNNEEHYAIMDYHGDIRATGAYGWKKFRGIMTPGVFYLMTVDGNTKTFRFKMSGTTLPTATSLALQLYAASGAGQSTDAGWNGVANPTLEHGTVNQTVTVLNPNTYTYEDKDAGEMNFVVGTPYFIQANATIVEQGMEMGAVDDTKPYYAPKRVSENGFENIKVFFGNDEYKDKLTISANVEALNEYQIGKDLVKMTMTNTPSVAQIFGNAYNAKLCRVYAPMANDQAEYSLTLYAPNAGEYTISAPEMEDADIFLTYEGSIIWNLSMSEYSNDFAKGNNEGYGLILVKKAPQVITGVDNAEANEAGVQKVIINDHVYILRAEQMYDVTGKMVK